MTATTFPDCPDCQAAVLHEHPMDDPHCTACGGNLDTWGHAHGCGNDPGHDYCGECMSGVRRCPVCDASDCADPAACRLDYWGELP